MIDIAQPDGPLSVEQTTALIAELLTNTPGGKLGSEDVADAIAAIGELYTAAATLSLWRNGRIKFGWDAEDEQLVLVDANRAPDAGQTGRAIFEGKS